MIERIGLELEMGVIGQRDGRSHAVTHYFEALANVKRQRGLQVVCSDLCGRTTSLDTVAGCSGLDNGYNLLETAFAPIPGGAGCLDRLAALVRQELKDVIQALDAEGAALLNASEHPDCAMDEAWYAAVRVDRPIYQELVGYRGWMHRVGIDAKAQNGPCTSVKVDQAARALNAMLALAPALIAIFANSPLEAGRETGLKENRLTIWDRMFAAARFPGDHFLQRMPPRPFEDLGDHYRWMFGAQTATRALPLELGQGYKSATSVFLEGDPPLAEFLRSDSWTGRSGPTAAPLTIRPRGGHFVYAQYAHFLDARWRYKVDQEPALDALLAAWDQPGGIEALLQACGVDGYIEGRAPGAVFADAQLIDELGPDIAATAPIAPSAVQLGLLSNLDQAEQLWRQWGWGTLRELRSAAIRDALADDRVRALAQDVLAVARAGLPEGERDWLGYAEQAVQTGRTGADRLLELWHAHAGRADRLVRIGEQRRVCVMEPPFRV